MPHCIKENGQYYYWTGPVTEPCQNANGKQQKRPVMVDGRNVQKDHERFIRVSNETDRLINNEGLDHKQARTQALKNVLSNPSSKGPSLKPGILTAT